MSRREPCWWFTKTPEARSCGCSRFRRTRRPAASCRSDSGRCRVAAPQPAHGGGKVGDRRLRRVVLIFAVTVAVVVTQLFQDDGCVVVVFLEVAVIRGAGQVINAQ